MGADGGFVYLDTSVALAWLLAEDRQPAVAIWQERLVASRLLEYELWTRVHARGLARTAGAATRELIGRVALVELASPVLSRVLEPFPSPVRTLDALHLATALFLRNAGQDVTMATYDDRLATWALAVNLPLYAGL